MQSRKPNGATQFLMFDSLKGFSRYLKEKEVIPVSKKELMSDALDELNWKIHELSIGQMVEIVYFERGKYYKTEGLIGDIDLEYKKYIQVVKKKIPIKSILSIKT